MIKFIYFSYLFSSVTLIIFSQSWNFNFINISLFAISIILNLVSLYFIFFKRKKIYKKKLWFILNALINLIFVVGMLYLGVISYLLTDVPN